MGFCVKLSNVKLGFQRGIALITTLLFMSVLVAMVSALFLVVRTKLFQSQTYHNQTAALYLAELAIADAMAELEADPTWTTGFSDKTYPGVEGRYSLRFQTGTLYSKNDSVNNVDGEHDETYRGPKTLLPGQVMLVATASVGRATRTVEAIVDLGGGLGNIDGPLIVDGRIVMSGKVSVDGMRSLGTRQPIPVNLHSNLSDSVPDLVVIDDSQSPYLSGTVTIVSTASTSVNTGTMNPAGGAPVLGSPAKAIAPVDIAAQVSAKGGASPIPGAVPVHLNVGTGSGSPMAAFSDVTVLDYSAGPDFYSGTSLVVGDLKLQGAALYVDGDLTVNGGIEGSGSVWVTGKTTFRGTSSITTGTPDRVALYSRGDVELQGFEGTELLRQYAATDVDIRETLTRIEFAFQDVSARMTQLESGGTLRASDLGQSNGWDVRSGTVPSPSGGLETGGRAWLGSGYNSTIRSGMGSAAHLVYTDPGVTAGGRHKVTDLGERLLFRRAQSPGRDFLIRRFYDLYEVNFGGRGDSWSEILGLADAKTGRLSPGAIDSINDNRYLKGVGMVKQYFDSFHLNFIGSSYFQGLVYTNGYFRSVNDVTIIGAIVTDVDPAARAGAVLTDAIPDPGDVILENGSRLVYIEDFFKPRHSGGESGPARVRLRLWCGR